MAGRTILEFYPFDIDSITTKEGRTLIRLFGVTKDNKKVIVLDPSLNPYFYVLINPEKSEKAINAATKMEVTAEERRIQPQKVEVVKRNFVGKPQTALKISVQQTGDIAALKEEAKKIPGYLDRVEVDISFTKRYLIDRKMSMLTLWRVTGEEAELKRHNADFFIKAEELAEVSDEVIADPKIIAFDIETYNPAGVPRQETDPIIMVSFLGKHGPKKVVTWKRFNDAPDYVDFVDSERELLQYFFNFLKKHKPDIIVGYNSDNFDLPYILSRAKKYNLNADVGIDGSELAIGRKAGNDVARIAGIVHIDLFVFIKNMLAPTMKTETFSLSAVAEELIGEKKLAGVNSENMFVMWDAGGNDLRTFAEYNLHDSQLTLNLMEKLKYSIFEVAKLVGQPLFDVSRMTYGQCVEWYLARWAERFNEFIPLRPISKTAWMRTYEGAYVHQPKPGVYNNMAILDFRSLYPSLIVSHNICPTTISCDCCKKGDLTPEINGKKYSFCKKKKGFIPSVIEDLINRRARIKEILKKVDKKDADYAILSARSYALKTVANAMYGYLGFAKSRWYSLECASSITAWGRDVINTLIKTAEKEGFDVIYADTDSVFLNLKDKDESVAHKFLDKVNKTLPSAMELELQGIYPKGLFVSKKGGEGAKKRYVLLDESGNLIIKGFQSVRRDWSKISKDVQVKVLRAILIDNSIDKAVSIIKETINRLKEGDVRIDEIVIHTQLTRRVESYESIGPHVAAVMKAQKGGFTFEPGQIIKFIVTKGEGSISDRSYILKEYLDKELEYDADYYIDNQVLPAVEKIFEVLGYSKEQLKGKVQTTLSGFFK